MAAPANLIIHHFTLLHVPCGISRPSFSDPSYDDVKAQPPTGCIPRNVGDMFALRCQRSALTLLEAVADVCAEVRSHHGILLTDLGVEKLWEWSTDGPNGFGATILSQLLLMAAERAAPLGYSIEDLTGFLSTATSRHVVRSDE
jgi:hypothetical protein